MSLFAVIGEALRALRLNRLRTGLTMLGMIIGVAAVVLMLAVGQGAQTMVNQAIASIGSNLFIVVPGATSSGALRSAAGSVQTLTMADAQAIAHLPSVKATAPLVTGTAQLNYGANNWSTSVTGVTPDYFNVREWPAESGALFTEADLRSASRVVMLGQLTAKNLFGDEDPTGKTVRIKNSPFVVAGVLAPKGQSLDGRDQDDSVFIPITTGQRQIFGNQFPGTIRFLMVQGISADAMDEAEAEINRVAAPASPHRRRNGKRFYGTQYGCHYRSGYRGSQGHVSYAWRHCLGIAAGRGYWHHEYHAGVRDRTNPGNRHTHGYRGKSARDPCAIPAGSPGICILGGLIGVALGIGGAWAVSRATDMIIVITFGTILLAFAFASAVGIFFGYYPARKAAALKPVEALRYE